jgi:hypothetical protein
MRGEKRRGIRESLSGRSPPGLIVGVLLILAGLVLLLWASNFLTSWSWVNFSTYGIYSVILLIVLGGVVAVYA